LDQVLTLRPERVAVYSFAFVPWLRAHMRHLPESSLPGPALKLQLLSLAIAAFTGAGYRQIGMDHFALPDDELARAVESRTLHRNFMGYTVQSARDAVALGVSGIGDVRGAFVQNEKKLSGYYAALDEGRLPVERGYVLDADDVLRRHVITQLMCNFHLDVRAVERAFGVSFHDYFRAEIGEITGAHSPTADGLVIVSDEAIDVTPRGRLLVRNVCMAFDRYLRERTAGTQPVFSRTV
jgi:oxygen-independent coproporphyrinogen-3 oxidase